MGLSGITTALSGIEAAQVGMDTVADNLANANTPSYVRQAVELGALAGGPTPVGTGVGVQGIAVQANQLLTALADSTSAQASSDQARSRALSSAQSVLNEPSSSGLQAQLSTMWSDWTAVANNPGSLASRTALLGAAKQVVASLHGLATGLASVSTDTQTQLSGLVGQVNQQLAQMANLNKAVVAGKAAGVGENGLVEQQQALAATLAQETGATITTSSTGSMTVKVGSTTLVQNTTVSSLTVSGSGPSTSIMVSGSPLAITSGDAAGLMSAITTDLPSWSSSLDQVAATLASVVNGQLAKGVSWTPLGSASATSSSGTPMFVASGGGAVTASNIEVSSAMEADPSTIAAGASSSTGPLDGTNAQALAALAGSTTGPDVLYQALVGTIGSAVQAAKAAESQTAAAATQAAATASASQGVDSNAQLTTMLAYQQMYESSGKVIGAAVTMFNSLLGEVP